jgi:hypothetical protein
VGEFHSLNDHILRIKTRKKRKPDQSQRTKQ